MFKAHITKLTETLSEFGNPLWLFGPWVLSSLEGTVKKCRCPVVSNILQFAQSECGSSFSTFPQNTSSMETGQFQIFLRSMLQVTHSRQIRVSLWEPFMMSMFKMQRTGHVPVENLQLCAKERVKGRGRFLFKLKNKKLTSRKCRVTAERLPQQLRFTDFQIRSP